MVGAVARTRLQGALTGDHQFIRSLTVVALAGLGGAAMTAAVGIVDARTDRWALLEESPMAGQPAPEPDKKRSEIPEVLPWGQYLRLRSSEVIARARNARQIATLARDLRKLYERLLPPGRREG